MKLCSDTVSSIQQSKKKESISVFPWEELSAEIREHCPTLYNLLISCTTTTSTRQNQQQLICTIVCMLCKFRRSNMSLLQRLVSALLYASHVGTEVCGTITIHLQVHVPIGDVQLPIYTFHSNIGMNSRGLSLVLNEPSCMPSCPFTSTESSGILVMPVEPLFNEHFGYLRGCPLYMQLRRFNCR